MEYERRNQFTPHSYHVGAGYEDVRPHISDDRRLAAERGMKRPEMGSMRYGSSDEELMKQINELDAVLCGERDSVTQLLLEKDRLEYQLAQERARHQFELDLINDEISMKGNIKIPEVASLEKDRKALMEEIAMVMEDKDQLTKELTSLREQLNAKMNEVNSIEDERTKLEKDYSLLVDEVKKIEQNKKDVLSKIEEEKKSIISDYQKKAENELAELQVITDNYKSESDKLREELNHELKLREQAEQACNQFKANIEYLNKEFEFEVLQRAEHWIKTYKRVAENYEKQLEVLKRQLADTEQFRNVARDRDMLNISSNDINNTFTEELLQMKRAHANAMSELIHHKTA